MVTASFSYSPVTEGFKGDPTEIEEKIKAIKNSDGGKWPPDVKGRKHVYPSKRARVAWDNLVRAAVIYVFERSYCYKHNLPEPAKHEKHTMFLFIFNCNFCDKEKQRKAKRGRDRKALGIRVGDPRQVHHHDSKKLTLASAEPMSHCEHRAMHNQTCITPTYKKKSKKQSPSSSSSSSSSKSKKKK